MANEQLQPLPQQGLQRNSIGLTTVLMQSIAQIAPAVGVLTTIAFNTQQAGLGAPSTYIAAFVIGLVVAISLSELGRHLPSAGGFYTYVSATVGPAFGFLVGWLYSWFVAIIPGGLASYTGFVLQTELQQHYGINLPWQIVTLAILLLVGFIGYRGIKVSGKMLTILSIIEMLIVLALAISGLVSPGPGGISFAGFNPANSTSLHGFYLAVVLSIFAFTGWEGAAAVAEEARSPRTIIPRAIIGSIILLGVYYVFCSWGIQIGWGTQHLDDLANATENPAFIVAQRLWGNGWLLVLLALLNSGIAVCIACTVDSTRNWYAMARAKALPAWLDRTHPAFRTPHTAVLAQSALALVVGLGVGSLVAPDQSFFMLGTLGTIIYVFVYLMGNIGVARFFLTTARHELNIIIHIAFPIVSTVALFLVLYYSLVPLPDPPVGYAPEIAAVLLLAGLLVLWRLQLSQSSDWKTLSQYVVSAEPTPPVLPPGAVQSSAAERR
jgi:amino acid transporter